MLSLNANPQTDREQAIACSPFLCLSLEILLPAFVADGLFLDLPDLQTSEGDTVPISEGLSAQACPASPCPDAAPLSILKELVELVREVRRRDTEEPGQFVPHFPVEVLGGAFFYGLVCIVAHADPLRHLRLHQPPAVPEPSEPVRDGLNVLIPVILSVEAGGLQNLPRGAQREAMDI